jgi:hypothetical protein
MAKRYMAIDQFGNVYTHLRHPRKDLMAQLGYQHAEKAYEYSRVLGGKVFIGYKIGRLVFRVFRVVPISEERL